MRLYCDQYAWTTDGTYALRMAHAIAWRGLGLSSPRSLEASVARGLAVEVSLPKPRRRKLTVEAAVCRELVGWLRIVRLHRGSYVCATDGGFALRIVGLCHVCAISRSFVVYVVRLCLTKLSRVQRN